MANLKVPVAPADHALGDEHAPVTLVEYGDYECPHCGHAHPIVKALRKHFGKQLRFVYRHFPLTQIHPHAESAAEAAEFAGVNGRFWEMHDGILRIRIVWASLSWRNWSKSWDYRLKISLALLRATNLHQ